ncbi:T9SS type A sorting domain-containing protein [Flavobacteriaceae bacterium]|nr:T9SS type A sorting domain-containing protein [Flavobacteriaceae bacterium]
MKFYNHLLIALIFSLNSINSFSQEMQYCATQTSEENLQFISDNIDLIRYYENEYYLLKETKTSTALTSIPVKVHIVTNDDGSGGIDINDVISELNEANTYLENSFVEFYVCDDVNYINSSTLYDFDSDTQQDLLFSNHQTDILNIYFVNDISFGAGGACGYTYLPGNSNQYYDVIVMDNDCTTSQTGTTLTHEIGHHLNLIHTHGSQNGSLTDELVNGSNCIVAGDLLCDTPADPELGYSNVNDVNCLYSVSGTPPTDAQGNLFDPDTSNIMSYAPQACTNSITDQQYARMYAGYHAYKNYYKCPSLNVAFNSDQSAIDCGEQLQVNFSDNSTNATNWEWDVNGDDIIDYTESIFSHTYGSPGNYDVSLKVSNGSETITKVFPNYISFEANLFETSKIYLNVSVKNGVNQNTWEFKDSSGSILYSGGPYDTANGVGETYSHEFDTGSDCYLFTMYDSNGDGLTNDSWNQGSEYYELLDENNVSIKYGRDFGSEESTSIKNEYLSLSNTMDINFMIYPNPAGDFINLKSDSAIDGYLIYDIKGSLILEGTNNNSNDLTISLKNIYSGIYFVQIKSGTYKETVKFIKK